MKSIDSIRDRLAMILREAGETNGINCSSQRRALMALLRTAVAEIDNAEWDVREAADYLGVSPAWLFQNTPDGKPTIRFDALRALALTEAVEQERAQESRYRYFLELGDDQ